MLEMPDDSFAMCHKFHNSAVPKTILYCQIQQVR
jgi:hypothetical protein